MSTRSVRAIRDGPFCWAAKEALRLIHDSFSETSNLPSAYAVYVALCIIASNEQSESFTVKKSLIAFRAGLSIRSADTILDRLEALELIQVERREVAGTKLKAPNTYTLLPIGNGCASMGNGCGSMRNGRLQPSVAEKVEERENKEAEESAQPLSSPKAREVKFSAAVVEEIYQGYPRRVARKPALKAILKALAEVAHRPGVENAADWLKGRVWAYWRSRQGSDPQFTPYPATWFNAVRFDEDFSAFPVPHLNGHGAATSSAAQAAVTRDDFEHFLAADPEHACFQPALHRLPPTIGDMPASLQDKYRSWYIRRGSAGSRHAANGLPSSPSRPPRNPRDEHQLHETKRIRPN